VRVPVITPNGVRFSFLSWNDNLEEEHLVCDVFWQTWRLGKSVKGNVVERTITSLRDYQQASHSSVLVSVLSVRSTKARDEEAAAVGYGA